MVNAICPYCKAKVNLEPKPKLGHRFECGACESELELVWIDPPQLDWPWELDKYEKVDYRDNFLRR